MHATYQYPCNPHCRNKSIQLALFVITWVSINVSHGCLIKGLKTIASLIYILGYNNTDL